MMTPAGFLRDEGFVHSLAIMGRMLSRLCYLRKMAWLMPRMSRAVPYLGYITVAGVKPSLAEERIRPVSRVIEGTDQR